MATKVITTTMKGSLGTQGKFYVNVSDETGIKNIFEFNESEGHEQDGKSHHAAFIKFAEQNGFKGTFERFVQAEGVQVHICKDFRNSLMITQGRWEAKCFQINSSTGDQIAHTGGFLPNNRAHESEGNAKLFAASKRLAVLLRGILDVVDNPQVVWTGESSPLFDLAEKELQNLPAITEHIENI